MKSCTTFSETFVVLVAYCCSAWSSDLAGVEHRHELRDAVSVAGAGQDERLAGMIRLRPELCPAGLFKPPGNQRVDDVVPGLQNGLAVKYRSFPLLGVAQFHGPFRAASGEDRQAHAGSHHVLQGTAFPEVGEIQRVEADGAVELDARIECANGNADGGGCGASGMDLGLPSMARNAPGA